ncbi:MAG TPA: Bax inhibitor-1/YccA family protein [Gemmatimonadales bacterium]|nr:Bax inhibitor-1/YccA family protein [Gemmatimonadales bacterium]
MANPVLNSKTFAAPGTATGVETMTIEGTVNKTGILLFLVVATACWMWTQTYNAVDPDAAMPWMWGGVLGGLAVGIATRFKPQWAPVTAPLYAALEGLALGGISAWYAAAYPGILIQAVSLTFITLFVMLLAYRSGLVRATPAFRKVIGIAMSAILLYYLVVLGMSLFGVGTAWFYGGGTLGIGISLLITGVAAFRMILDFDLIEQGVQQGAPKAMEWYGAFALVVGLIWLYLEILRLLGRLRRR